MFLEVITRHLTTRPVLLEENQASLAALESEDWRQMVLIDPDGRGVGWSYENLMAHAGELQGRYIWLLDDDDVCIRPSLVDELKGIADEANPDVIMVRMDHGPRGILPDDRVWERRPAMGRIGCSAYVVKREIWQRHATAFEPGYYASDFNFIDSIFRDGVTVFWHDVIASKVQQIGMGK